MVVWFGGGDYVDGCVEVGYCLVEGFLCVGWFDVCWLLDIGCGRYGCFWLDESGE